MATIRIPHTVNLVTEIDASHPDAQRLMALDNPSAFLAEMFETILINEGWLDAINEGGSYAILKLDK